MMRVNSGRDEGSTVVLMRISMVLMIVTDGNSVAEVLTGDYRGRDDSRLGLDEVNFGSDEDHPYFR